MLNPSDFKICYLNARSLHKHIDNISSLLQYIVLHKFHWANYVQHYSTLLIKPVINLFIGDFNVNWLVGGERQSLYNVMVRYNGYRQLIDNPTTDNALIDHIYTNIVDMETIQVIWKCTLLITKQYGLHAGRH